MSIHEAKGRWRGASQPHLSLLPPGKQITTSDSELHVDTDAHDAYATITYHWEYEGKRQEGAMLVYKADKSNAVEMGWADSWHQSSGVMHLAGQVAADGSLKVSGPYSAGKETWGWTISFHHQDDQFTLEMENITPAGEAEWAVRATYKRQ